MSFAMHLDLPFTPFRSLRLYARIESVKMQLVESLQGAVEAVTARCGGC